MALPIGDIALAYDPVTRTCDLVFDGRDLVLDRTPATALLVALGTDRRAHPDDLLPDVEGPFGAPRSFDARRGFPGDFLDAFGRLMGSRLWLVADEKQTEAVRKLVESIVVEAVEPIEARSGLSAVVQVQWVRPRVLGVRVALGDDVVAIERAIGA